MKRIYLFENPMRSNIRRMCLSFCVVALTLLVQRAAAQTTVYNYTGGVQTWTVPAGVMSVAVDVIGAPGGPAGPISSLGTTTITGLGGRTQATLAVTPGQVLYIYVGGAGDTGASSGVTTAAFNGGGLAASYSGAYSGGGGGGASDIRINGTSLSNRVVVAGGGGGGGYNGGHYGGGAGGNLTGGTGSASPPGTAGTGGTQTAGGTGGGYPGYTYGSAGTLGVGGASQSPNPGIGGGGGGGYYGGGGGGWSGGGGGSSFADLTVSSSVSYTAGYNSSGTGGQVSITPLTPPTVFYSDGTGNANDLNSWWSNPGGTGVHPTDFTTAGYVFNMITPLTSTGGTWTLGAATTLNLNSVTFTVNLDTINAGNLNITGSSYWNGQNNDYVMIYGSFSLSGTSWLDNPPLWNYFYLANISSTISSPQTISLTTTTSGSYSYLYVNPGVTVAATGNGAWDQGDDFTINGTYNCQNFSLYAPNGFFVTSGATIYTQNALGLDGSITGGYTNFYNGANYIFNGTTAQVTGSSFPNTITSPGSLTINNSAGVSMSGDLYMDAGSNFNMTSGKFGINGHQLSLNGTVTGHSPVNCFTGSATSDLILNTTPDLGWLYMDQSVDGSTNALDYYAQFQSGGTTLAGKLVVNTQLALNSSNLYLNDHQLTLNGAFIGHPYAALSGSALSALVLGGSSVVGTLYFDQTTPGTTNALSSLTMNTTGSATLGNNLNIGGGDLNLNSGTLDDGGNLITLTGNITGTGTHTSTGSGEILMTSPYARISGATLGSVELNNASGFSLTGAPTFNGTLTFTAGNLPMGGNNVTFGPNASIGGTPSASGMLVENGTGVAVKLINANGSFMFPIGDASLNYTPATVNFVSGAYSPGANITAQVVDAKQPNNANSTNYINRYWHMTTAGITSPAYSVDATYVPGDVVGTEANIAAGEYAGALPWKRFGLANTVTHTISSGVVNDPMADFSGISSLGPVVTATPISVAICNGASTTLSVATSSGDPTLSYTWAPATGLSATTGTSVTASPTSTTTYTLTITDGNGLTSTATSTVTVNPLPNQYSVTGGGAYCAGGTGVSVMLGNSDAGISYQLYHGATAVGSAMAGNGSALNFGPETAGGAYTVIATDTATLCTQTMSGSATVTVNPLPTLYTVTVTHGGAYCAGDTGVHVGLSSSQAGISYQLFNGATAAGTAMNGSGSAIDFGLKTDTGTYTVIATDTTTLCTRTMTGSATVVVNPLPTTFTVIGGGNYCAGTGGVHVNLSTSDTGINYQLFMGSSAAGGPIPGIGSLLDFGAYTAAGTYTVMATNAWTGCMNAMAGAAVISIIPAPNSYTVTGGGSYCAGGTGVNVGLNYGDNGVRYQLYHGVTGIGSPIDGTDTAISFGPQTLGGSYTVVATDTTTTCTSVMAGSVSVAITPTVTPTVTLGTAPGTRVCQGTSVTFSATPTNGGSAPVYTWMVNGSIVATTGTSYSYTPVNTDMISVKLRSNATCATPDTAMNNIVMTVDSNRMPVVTITANPGDIVCDGTTVRFSSATLYGGTTPRIEWVKNGTVVATTTNYSYIPVNGDVITATLNSNFTCRLATNVFSHSIVMSVDSPIVPLVTINEKQGPVIGFNRTDTLVAVVSNGGTAPLYQWTVNGGIVPGATSNTFIRNNFLNKDSVSVKVTRQDACGLSSFNSVIVYVTNLGVGAAGANTNVTVVPNPNKGEFSITGTIGAEDKDVTLEVTDMLGQVVYTNNVTAVNGNISAHVQLGNNIANGMYLLNVKSGGVNSVFHIVVEK